MTSPLRLGLLAGLLALTACDSGGDPPPAPPAFTLAVVAGADTLESADATPAASLDGVAVASVQLAPRRDVPEDPELRRRWEAIQILVAVLNAASDDEYEAGHYLIGTETEAAGATLVTAAVECPDGTYTLAPGSPWLEAPGAVFFPVRVDAEVGPAVTFRPFGLGGAGRLTFEGAGETATVEAPALPVAPALVTDVISEAEVALQRGTSDADVTLVLRRGPTVRGAAAGSEAPRQRVTLPAGDGFGEVYLFETADDEGACPTVS